MKDLMKLVRFGTQAKVVPSENPSQAANAGAVSEMPETAPNQIQSDYVGYFDKIGAGHIVGWAAQSSAPNLPVSVRILLDDTLVAEGEASRSRHDVRDAGYGEGLHGFEFNIPKKALFCAEYLTLAVVAPEGEVICARVMLRAPVVKSAPRLYMDASDLIEFLTHHRELSGIQRVQAGYLLGLGNAVIGKTTCRICTRFKTSSFYFEIPYERFVLLLRTAGDLSAVPAHGWLSYVRALKEQFNARAELGPGDVLFTMGAPWALDDHNETVRCAKLFYGVRYFQIFYDLIPISAPEFVAAPLIPHFARAMAAMSVYADHVFAISNYSAEDLSATLNKLDRSVPPLSVIPMGGTITDAETPSVRRPDILAGLGIDGPFVLCVGTLEPRKNHMLLFQVWRRLVASYGAFRVPKMVFVGRVGWYMEDFMRILKISGHVEKTIVHLMGVSNAELSALYDHCMFTIFPSFSEGWGLPITESLSRYKVCVCSNSTSMPEAGGDHAIYIDPFSVKEAYAVCESLIFDNETLKRQEMRLLETFKALTWAEASRGLMSQFESLLDQNEVGLQSARRKPIKLGRTYKYYNIEASQPDATSTMVFGNFLDQEDALDLLVGWNWFELDAGCTWACGLDAVISITVPAEDIASDLVAYVEVMRSDNFENVPCEIVLDGLSMGFFRPGRTPKKIAVPINASKAEHEIGLRFCESRLPSGDDIRWLGIGIRTIAIYRKSDYEDRLAFYESEFNELVSSQ